MNKKEGEKTSSSVRADAAAKKLLLESLVKKADYYCSREAVTDMDLYFLVKDFFREFLDLKYEFSFDELLTEIDKTYLDTEQREKTIAFINRIEHVEYAKTSFKDEEVKTLVKEFSLLSKSLIKMSEPKKESFWTKLGRFFTRKKGSEAVAKTDSQTSESKGIFAARSKKLDVLTDDDLAMTREKISFEDYDTLTEMRGTYKENQGMPEEDKTAQQAKPLNATATEFQSSEAEKKYLAGPDVFTKYYNAKRDADEAKKAETYDWLKTAETKGTVADKKTGQKAAVKKTEQKKAESAKTSPPKEKAKEAKAVPSKEDIADMIARAKKLKNRNELIALYKKIHSIYESGDFALQTKYYDSVMDVYKSIAKVK